MPPPATPWPLIRRCADTRTPSGVKTRKAGLGRALGVAAVEVVVGERTGEVTDDRLAPAFDRAKGVDPVSAVGIHRVQRLRVPVNFLSKYRVVAAGG